MSRKKEEQELDYLFKLVIIGDSGVGKTNLLSRYARNAFNHDSKTTIGVELATKTTTIDGKSIQNLIWDTAGQQRFRAIITSYYRNAVGAVVVFDLSKSVSFENLPKWLKEVKEHAEPDVTIMLIGNKSDLPNRQVPPEAVERLAEEGGYSYLETSALIGENVKQAFDSLIKEIYDKQVFKEKQELQTPSKKELLSKVTKNSQAKGTVQVMARKKPHKKTCC